MSVTVTFRDALQPQQYRERREARMLRGRHFTADTQAIMNHHSTAPKRFIFLVVSRAGLEPPTWFAPDEASSLPAAQPGPCWQCPSAAGLRRSEVSDRSMRKGRP